MNLKNPLKVCEYKRTMGCDAERKKKKKKKRLNFKRMLRKGKCLLRTSPVHKINHLQLFFQRIVPVLFLWSMVIPVYFRAPNFVYIQFILHSNIAQLNQLLYF